MFIIGEKPFAPVLFWNNDTLRVIVTPERKWIDPVCSVCLNGRPGEKEKITADLDEFDEKRKKFGISIFKQAMRIKLFNMGVETYSKRVKQAMHFIDDEMAKSNFNLEELADRYKLKEVRTKQT